MSYINKIMRDIRSRVDDLEQTIGDVVPARHYRDLITFLRRCRDIMEQTLPFVPEGDKRQELQIYLNIVDGFLSAETSEADLLQRLAKESEPPVARPVATDSNARSPLKPAAKKPQAKRRP